MKNKTAILPKPSNLAEIGILLLIIKTFISISSIIPRFEIIENFLTIVPVLLFLLDVFKKEFTPKQLISISIVLILFAVVCYNIKSIGIFITVFTCITMIGRDIDKIIRFIFNYELIFFLIHCFVGALLTLFGQQLYIFYHGYIRYSLGFGHPNVLSAIAFNLIIMWLWLNYETAKFRNYISIAIFEAIIYSLTKTRTSLYLLFILYVLLFIFKNKNKDRFLTFISSMIVPTFSISLYYLVVHYIEGNHISHFFDRLLTRRIALASYAFERNGITILGRDMRTFSTEWDIFYGFSGGGFTFDNTYTYLMMNAGCALLILLSILFIFISRKNVQKNNIFLIIWALYSITEIHGLSCYMCFPILLTVTLFEKKNYQLKNDNNKEENNDLCTCCYPNTM